MATDLIAGSTDTRTGTPRPQADLSLVADPPARSAPVSPRSPRRAPAVVGGCQWLLQREGSFWERGRVLEFPGSIHEGTLGRSFSCNWRFNEPTVSRLHAALVRRPRRGIYLVDLGSNSGTFVNERRVSGEWLLMDGDRIRLGSKVELQYIDGPPPVEAPERAWIRRALWAAGGMGALLFLTLFLIF